MIILGVDFHPEFQQIASVDIDTGEFQEKRLAHREEAEKFYRALRAEGASGDGSQWTGSLTSARRTKPDPRNGWPPDHGRSASER